ncbi:MAG TPA: hypothetical protein VHG91_18975 [Longimicrobium sp.]|nr:hypothetical protein [Longimicrobium sp.]
MLRGIAPIVALAAALALSSTPAEAQVRWRVEGFGGSALSLPSRLTVRQAGEATVRMRARWETRPLADAPYYAYRVERWEGDAGWAVELLHHKVYLRNETEVVQHFEVSHGYNQLTLARAWGAGRWVTRAGAGVVIAHPENTIRGRPLDEERGLLTEGYHFAGVAAQAARGVRVRLAGRFDLIAEAKVTAAWARVPVEGGSADVPNAAAHGLVGVGYTF